MFAQKKKRFRGIRFMVPLAGILILVFLLIYWLKDDGRMQENREKDGIEYAQTGASEIYRYHPDTTRKQDAAEKKDDIQEDLSDMSRFDTKAEEFSEEMSLDEPDEKNEASEKAAESDASYTGYVAVYKEPDVMLQKYEQGILISEEKTTISPALLPEYDRKLLKKGLYLKTTAELEEFLQDYEG